MAGTTTKKSKATAPSEGGDVSVADDSLDSMVQAASIPSLATLFKRGKEAGLLKGVTHYGEHA